MPDIDKILQMFGGTSEPKSHGDLIDAVWNKGRDLIKGKPAPTEQKQETDAERKLRIALLLDPNYDLRVRDSRSLGRRLADFPGEITDALRGTYDRVMTPTRDDVVRASVGGLGALRGVTNGLGAADPVGQVVEVMGGVPEEYRSLYENADMVASLASMFVPTPGGKAANVTRAVEGLASHLPADAKALAGARRQLEQFISRNASRDALVADRATEGTGDVFRLGERLSPVEPSWPAGDPRGVSHLSVAPAARNAEGSLIVSGRVPGGPRASVESLDPLTMNATDILASPSFKASDAVVPKLAARLRQSLHLTEKEAAMDDMSVLQAWTDAGKRNIHKLVDLMSPYVERSRQWYDGANKISKELASTHGLSSDATSAVIAVLSPQKEWNANVEQARRAIKHVATFNSTDPVFDADVFAKYASNRADSLEESIKTRMKKGMSAATADRHRAALPMELRKIQSEVLGQRWSDLTDSERAIFLRSYDELVQPKTFSLLTPEGDVFGPAKNLDRVLKSGKVKPGDPTLFSWQDYGAIEKALSVLADPSPDNISRQLGNEHKVRAFFNNINAPKYGGSSTVDTHQVAATHWRPMGSKSPDVEYSMGGISNSASGMSGSNGMYQQVLDEVGAERGMLPREVQSVSWEGLRQLFSPSQKRNKAFVAKIEGIWKEYRSGKMKLENVYDAILNEANGGTGSRALIPPFYAKSIK